MSAPITTRNRRVDLTQSAFTLLCGASPRAMLDLYNEGGSAVQLYSGPAPWCLTFDGGDHVEADALATNATFLASTDGSIAARVNVTANAAVKTIFSASDLSANEFMQFGLDASEKLFATLRTAAAVQWTLTCTAALVPGQWYRVKLVHNGTTPVLYVDGAQWPQTFSVTTDKTAWIAGLSNIDTGRIGSINTNAAAAEAEWWVGQIRDLQVYDGTAADKLTPDLNRVLVANFKLQDGTGTTVTDSSGNALDGAFGAGAAAPVWDMWNAYKSLGAASGFLWDTGVPRDCIYAYTTDTGIVVEVTQGWR